MTRDRKMGKLDITYPPCTHIKMEGGWEAHWDCHLTLSDIKALKRGTLPHNIRKDHLTYYAPPPPVETPA